jgi:hypothetical protein
MDFKSIAIGIFLILLGLSYGYRCFLAMFFGQISYWQGFLPFTLVSPLFIHFPAGKRSLIKTTTQWWVHVICGPAFLLLSTACLATGADQLGLPGSAAINYVLTFGGRAKSDTITYSKESGYRFPIFNTVKKVFDDWESKPMIPEKNN